MDSNFITISTLGTDPAESLQVKLTKVSTVDTTTSIKELRERIALYDAQLAVLTEQKAADVALLDEILGIFTSAGVVDMAEPLTDELTSAIRVKNAETNRAIADTATIEIAQKKAEVEEAIQIIK